MEPNDKKIVLGQKGVPQQSMQNEFVDDEFKVPTTEVELPSLGAFYPNGKKSVTIKYLTAEEDDVLFSPELIKSGKVLDALLQIAIVDQDLHPNDMLVGDRNTVLIHLRRTGLGDIYKPGKMTCPSCGEEYYPEVDLSRLELKKLKDSPDENGCYSFKLPNMDKNIKFRMLNGKDENRIAKASEHGTK